MRLAILISDACYLSEGLLSVLKVLHQTHQIVDLEAGKKEVASTVELLICVGGDGFLLETMRKYCTLVDSYYAINAGHVGFLANTIDSVNLLQLESIDVYPLAVEVFLTSDQSVQRIYAWNDINILRQGAQALHLELEINNQVVIEKLIGDGINTCTPLGSTGYNYSIGGLVLPLDSGLLALMGVNAGQPKRWNGALVKASSVIKIKVLDVYKRPGRLCVDNLEFYDVGQIVIRPTYILNKLYFNQKQTFLDRVRGKVFS